MPRRRASMHPLLCRSLLAVTRRYTHTSSGRNCRVKRRRRSSELRYSSNSWWHTGSRSWIESKSTVQIWSHGGNTTKQTGWTKNESTWRNVCLIIIQWDRQGGGGLLRATTVKVWSDVVSGEPIEPSVCPVLGSVNAAPTQRVCVCWIVASPEIAANQWTWQASGPRRQQRETPKHVTFKHTLTHTHTHAQLVRSLMRLFSQTDDTNGI